MVKEAEEFAEQALRGRGRGRVGVGVGLGLG